MRNFNPSVLRSSEHAEGNYFKQLPSGRHGFISLCSQIDAVNLDLICTSQEFANNPSPIRLQMGGKDVFVTIKDFLELKQRCQNHQFERELERILSDCLISRPL